jgi:transcriptional regulator with XRE-family HTH domain
VLFGRILHSLRALQDVEKVVGQTIRKLRRKKSLTQEQLADLAGINRTHMYRIENGYVCMRIDTLKLIADTLGVRARELMRNV